MGFGRRLLSSSDRITASLRLFALFAGALIGGAIVVVGCGVRYIANSDPVLDLIVLAAVCNICVFMWDVLLLITGSVVVVSDGYCRSHSAKAPRIHSNSLGKISNTALNESVLPSRRQRYEQLRSVPHIVNCSHTDQLAHEVVVVWSCPVHFQLLDVTAEEKTDKLPATTGKHSSADDDRVHSGVGTQRCWQCWPGEVVSAPNVAVSASARFKTRASAMRRHGTPVCLHPEYPTARDEKMWTTDGSKVWRMLCESHECAAEIINAPCIKIPGSAGRG